MTSVNHVALQHPAPGRFSLAELTWVWVPTQRVGKMLTACIPANRVGDLHAGEAARAGTNEPPKETSGCGGKRSERFVCQREKPAPKKPRKRAPAGNGNNKKKRRGAGLLHGEEQQPLKVGCPVSYTIKIENASAIVRCAALEHTHATDTAARYHASWIKPWIACEFRRSDGKVECGALLAQIQAISQDAECLARGFHNWSEALDQFEAGNATLPREALASRKYVMAALTALHTDRLAFASDECHGVAHFVDTHREDVFYYTPGEKVVGEEEHVRALRCVRGGARARLAAALRRASAQ